jgi:2-phosphosulfolactate phosphatase
VKLDVLLGEAPVAPADVADRVVVVIDVLRAATTAAMALSNGARALIPYESVEEAAQRARTMDQDTVRLGGERRMVRIPGFEFGNSPLEYTHELVVGRTIVFTTTNGTLALAGTHGAHHCFFASFVNAQATIDAVCAASDGALDITIVCSGTERHLALEDAVCAGRLVRGVRERFPDAVCGDGARLAEMIERPYQADPAALAQDATHARTLIAAGFADDVTACLAVDTLPVAVRYHERQLRAIREPANHGED